MANPTRPSGRLPARVYWFRRLLVLGTALGLVFGIAQLLNGGAGDPATDQAEVVSAPPTTTVTGQAAGPNGALAGARSTATPRATPTPTALAEPDGPCAADEVTVKPVTGTAAAGREVPLVLQVSGTRPACTFAVSGRSLVAKVTSTKGKVWSTQDCPSAVSASTIVVRSAAPTSIQVSWSGRSSDGSCSRVTPWALPGNYQVTAAALGSEPSNASLKLTVPERPVVIKTIQPKKPKATKQPEKKQSSAPTTPDTGH